ncbi:hypothetical protein Pelo_15326 [Pelomyxa schiedti]|nr:hypothetical protein Pelo_15326 [Pelomyxa schiedti]
MYRTQSIIEFGALIALRHRYPQIRRPFSINGSNGSLVLLFLFPTLFCCTTVVSALVISISSAAVTLSLCAAILVLGLLFQFLYPHNLPQPPSLQQLLCTDTTPTSSHPHSTPQSSDMDVP